MAGIVPKRPASGRKQWTIHGGPKSSLKRLRNQLASDGCPESQVVLAKQLLDEECEQESEKSENARLGVYWLIKASEQGNAEATSLLRTCLRNGRGITEHNYMDAKLCVETAQDEKLARRAAREMFASLSAGGEYITSMQLEGKILSIATATMPDGTVGNAGDDTATSASGSKGGDTASENATGLNSGNCGGVSCNYSDGESTPHGFSSHSYFDYADYQNLDGDIYDKNGCIGSATAPVSGDPEVSRCYRPEVEDSRQRRNQKLTEDHLVAAAVDYAHGNLPAVSRVLCLTDPDLKALDRIPLMHRSILHPWLALKILYFKLIRYLGRNAATYLLPLLKSDLQLMILIIAYTLFSADNALYLLPMLLYYTTLAVMVCTTFRMLHDRRGFVDYRMWSGLFITYSRGALNAEELEHQYIRNNLKPYGTFFVALLGNLLVYPVISDRWIPQSELTIIAFLLTFMTLFGFMLPTSTRRNETATWDPLILFSFAVNVLAKYPYDTDPVVAQGWRFLELNVPTFPSYVIGNGIEFCINFKMALYALIPCLFAKMAARNGWRGTYRVLIPHCVTLSWLQVFIISAQGCTAYGILRGTLALVGIAMFLPLLGITSVVLPAVALTKWFLINVPVLAAIAACIVLSVAGLVACRLLAKSRFGNYVAGVQTIMMVMAIAWLLLESQKLWAEKEHQEQKPETVMTWDVFQRFCQQPVWQDENVALSQTKCHHLEGIKVHWNGYVNDIKIREIRNTYKTIFDKIPVEAVRRYLYCLYGEKVEPECDNVPSLVKEDCVSFYESVRSVNECSLKKYDTYVYEIILKMQSGLWGKSTEVVLITDDYFRSFALRLKPTDHIWLRGRLFSNPSSGADAVIGGLRPHVRPTEIGCVSCQDGRLTEMKIRLDVEGAGEMTAAAAGLEFLARGAKFICNVLFNPIVVVK